MVMSTSSLHYKHFEHCERMRQRVSPGKVDNASKFTHNLLLTSGPLPHLSWVNSLMHAASELVSTEGFTWNWSKLRKENSNAKCFNVSEISIGLTNHRSIALHFVHVYLNSFTPQEHLQEFSDRVRTFRWLVHQGGIKDVWENQLR